MFVGGSFSERVIILFVAAWNSVTKLPP